MLTIKNHKNLNGKSVESKWFPNIKDWAVFNVIEMGGVYVIDMRHENGNSYFVNLSRTKDEGAYELFAYADNSNLVRMLLTAEALKSQKYIILHLCMILDKIFKENENK